MAVEIRVPSAGESITEVYIGPWRASVGEAVSEGDILVELETDKATLELPAPVSGTVTEIAAEEGDRVEVGALIGLMEESDPVGAAGSTPPAGDAQRPAGDAGPQARGDTAQTGGRPQSAGARAEDESERAAKEADDVAATPRTDQPAAPAQEPAAPAGATWEAPEATGHVRLTPSARRLLTSLGLSIDELAARVGQAGVVDREAFSRMTKDELLRALQAADGGGATRDRTGESDRDSAKDADRSAAAEDRAVKAVRMSPIRVRIAERLIAAQQTAALLTTFNEVDMTRVIDFRAEYQEAFQKKHGVKLGFMSFFVKASVVALTEFPQINAQIGEGDRGPEILYPNYCDIGVAIGGGKGLVVPVLRNAERMGFAEIERTIGDLAARARENKITLQELQGGTFTISNGGVYGSLMSTPIVNPPQSGILGLHAIQDRPVAHNGEVVVRKMMYVALTYDHRIVDGREAVAFLRRIKECVERPERMLVNV